MRRRSGACSDRCRTSRSSTRRSTSSLASRCGGPSRRAFEYGKSYLVPRNGCVPGLFHLLQDSVELLAAPAVSTCCEVLARHERRHLLGECGRDELVDGDVLALRELTNLTVQRFR